MINKNLIIANIVSFIVFIVMFLLQWFVIKSGNTYLILIFFIIMCLMGILFIIISIICCIGYLKVLRDNLKSINGNKEDFFKNQSKK